MMTATKARENVSEPAPAMPPKPLARAKAWPAFLALLRKETRELALAAVLTGVAYALILAYVLYMMSKTAGANPSYDLVVLWRVFLHTTILVAPVAGLVLGFVQFLPDSRTSRLGFMRHRPFSPTALFAGKAAAGLAVYATAMGVPLLVALWWASQPRHIPLPFAWAMGLAPVADICWGVAYYCAGVLVAVRSDARWLGSRLLPLAGPIVATLLVGIEASFGESLWHSGLAVLVIALAARAYYVAAGQYGSLRAYAKTLTGAVLANALVVVGFIALGMLMAFTSHRTVATQTWVYPIILRDGTPAVQEGDLLTGVTIVRDLKGVSLGTVPRDTSELASSPLRTVSLYTGYATAYDASGGHAALRDSTGYFAYEGSLYGTGDWYRAMEKAGADYLVAFDATKRKVVGAIGSNGLEEGVAVPQARFTRPFHVGNALQAAPEAGLVLSTVGKRTYAATLIATENTVYGLTAEGKFKTVWVAPEEIQYLFALPTDDPQAEAQWAIVTTKQVLVMTPLTGVPPQPIFHYARSDLGDYQVSLGRAIAPARFVMQLTPWDALNARTPLAAFRP